MNYNKVLTKAKQLVAQSKVTRVVTESGDICLAAHWDGPVVFTIKHEKGKVKVYDSKGKIVKEPKNEPKTIS